MNFWHSIWMVLLESDAAERKQEGTWEEFHLGTCWVSFAWSDWDSNLTDRDCQLIYSCNWKLSKFRQGFAQQFGSLSPATFLQQMRLSASAISLFLINGKPFLIHLHPHSQKLVCGGKTKGNISISPPIYKPFLPTALLALAPLQPHAQPPSAEAPAHI